MNFLSNTQDLTIAPLRWHLTLNFDPEFIAVVN